MYNTFQNLMCFLESICVLSQYILKYKILMKRLLLFEKTMYVYVHSLNKYTFKNDFYYKTYSFGTFVFKQSITVRLRQFLHIIW